MEHGTWKASCEESEEIPKMECFFNTILPFQQEQKGQEPEPLLQSSWARVHCLVPHEGI